MAHRFGFIVHPLTPFQRRVFGVRSLDANLALGRASQNCGPKAIARLNMGVESSPLEGTLVSLPLLPSELLSNQRRGISQVEQGVRLCEEAGCSIVGLGGVAAMIGGQGKVVSRQTQTPITSGNHLTAETAFQTTMLALSKSGLKDRYVAMIGLPSPVGLLLAKMLMHRGISLQIVSKSPPAPMRKLFAELVAQTSARIDVVPRIGKVTAKVLVAASSTGARIPVSTIPSNTLVLDVAAPADIQLDIHRNDVLVVDGEYLSPPSHMKGDLWQHIYRFITRQPNCLFACFVEPMLIAAAKRPELCGVGRNLDLDKARALGELASRYGFLVDGLYRHGRRISQKEIADCLG